MAKQPKEKKITLTKQEVWELYLLGFCKGNGGYGPPALSPKMEELGFVVNSVENGHGGYSSLNTTNFKKGFQPVDEQ